MYQHTADGRHLSKDNTHAAERELAGPAFDRAFSKLQFVA
jgi:hypothetical protein